MDYYQNIRSDMIRKVMYPVDHRKDYVPKREDTSKVKIEPKAPCIPRFVSPIEGNAVEEGARIFFEGIVDAQPHPKFKWYFEDELIVPGKPGWEEAEIHHSRKMSTLIIRYTREYHMGRFSLLAKNELGYDVCSCDLIVRKKQFPPVFWKRLINTSLNGGQRYVMEVEVGGWPIPDVYWYRNDEMIVPKIVTENYNHYFNAYVPEKKVEIVQIDQIRHAIIISRLSESDGGKYTVYAKNAIGEAVCEADIDIEEGEGCYTSEELFLPEGWRNGKRLTWKDEDERAKKFVGKEDPELTDDDIRDMTKRVSSTPLPKSLEYLASLPDYKPDKNALKNLIPMTFKPDPKSANRSSQSNKAPVVIKKPSKFTPGTIVHRGYKCDMGGSVYPVWRSSLMKNQPRRDFKYSSVHFPSFPKKDARRVPKDIKDPPCPHIWESHDKIDELYRILGEMRERDRSESHVPPYSKKKLEKKMSASSDNVDSPRLQRKDNKKVHFEEGAQSEHAKKWSEVLDQNIPGSQTDAEKFTKEFINELSGSVAPGSTKPLPPKPDQKAGTHSNYLTRANVSNEKSKVAMPFSSISSSFEPKRSHGERFRGGPSPLESNDESSSTSAQTVIESTKSFKQFQKEISQIVQEQVVQSEQERQSQGYHEYVPLRSNTVPGTNFSNQSEIEAMKDSQDYIPVREKVKMIALQHEEIVKKEEEQIRGGNDSEAFVPGGVRILPPSPITVRKEMAESERHVQQEFYSQSYSESKMTSSSQVHVYKGFIANNEEDSSLAQDESTLDISRHSYAGTETSDAQYSDTSKEDSMIIYSEEKYIASPLAKSRSFIHNETPSMMLATQGEKSSASAPSTPQNSRRTRTKSEHQDQSKGKPAYRVPPTAPFQPSFYKLPPKEDPAYSGSHQPVFKHIKKLTKKRPKDTERFSDSEN